MSDIRRQVIYVDDDNEPDPKKIIYEVPQPEEGYSWISEVIIFPRLSNNLHNTYASFKNYSREEVMKMKKLDIFNLISC